MRIATPRTRFFDALESLRGIAALVVVFTHLPRTHFQTGIVANGYLMVDLFFVLSGFVLTHSYRDKLREGMDWGEFALLRLGRLYPLHLFVLICFLAADAFTQFSMKTVTATARPLKEYRPEFVLVNILLVQGWNIAERLSINRPSWSIGCEFYTYLIFAVVAARRRNGARSSRWRP